MLQVDERLFRHDRAGGGEGGGGKCLDRKYKGENRAKLLQWESANYTNFDGVQRKKGVASQQKQQESLQKLQLIMK